MQPHWQSSDWTGNLSFWHLRAAGQHYPLCSPHIRLLSKNEKRHETTSQCSRSTCHEDLRRRDDRQCAYRISQWLVSLSPRTCTVLIALYSREAELSEGFDGRLATVEPYVACLDALPMAIAFAALA